jgi:hypothetical protein
MPRILTNWAKTPMFTVDRVVGRNAPNDRLDVLLVQFLMFICTPYVPYYLATPVTTVPRGLRVATPVAGVATATLTHPKPQGDIIIDGVCGDQTIGFIEYFQEVMKLNGAGRELNGQVAPQWTIGTTTMYRLNYIAANHVNPWNLGESNAFPQELKTSFYY